MRKVVQPVLYLSPALLVYPPCSLDITLSLPDPLDGLGNTNIVRLEFVQANSDQDGSSVQSPHKESAECGMFPIGNVVDDDGLKAHVAVHQHQGAEGSIHSRVERAGGVGRDGERDETCSDQSLEGPVV
jgi:hypothetical protein